MDRYFDPLPPATLFKVGDTVVLKTGTAPQIVTNIKQIGQSIMMQTEYTRHFQGIEKVSQRWRNQFDYKEYPYDPVKHNYETQKPDLWSLRSSKTPSDKIFPEENPLSKLYQTNEETPRFGTFLARNSAGLIVLEMKTSNTVEAFEPTAVEEVKPYTIAVKLEGGAIVEFESTKGSLNEGDLVFLEESLKFGFVSKINTGYTGRTQMFKGRRILTETVS